ncbi:Maf family protein [Anaerobacillus sp. MEB173]|uniref:Maf family protein n=1 Tax=Anaerobacillus sp. MEB173 TaxID=3383345 RepID=UPI003F90D009
MKQLILASGSPRRKELLEQAHLQFSIITSDIQELVDPTQSPGAIVESLALQKASAVAKDYPQAVVLGADTIVTHDQKVLGKPENAADAKNMLQSLSGNSHEVYTGVAIVTSTETITFHERTKVTFWDLKDEEIDQYIESGEPFDKAGAYGIQGFGATLVKGIVGDYFSVVGLPLARTVRELEQFGLKPVLTKHETEKT